MLAQCELDSGTLGDGFSLGGLHGEVLARDIRVADGHAVLGADVDVAQDDAGDGGFGEADDGSGGLAAGGRHILNRDVVEVGGEAGDGGRGHFACGEDLGVVLADDESVFDVLHLDVAEGDVADIGTAVAVGFDPNAIVGAGEMNALDEDVLRPAGDFAADGDAVAMQEGAIGDGDVAAGCIGAGRVGGAGLDRDVIVANVGVEVIDVDVRRGEGIETIRIGRMLRRKDLDVVDRDVVRVVGDDLPHGGVLDGDSVHEDVLAMVEDDEAGARVFRSHDAMILDAAGLLPPALAVPVDDAVAGDGEIGCVGGADEGLVAGGAEFGDGRIVSVIGGAEEGGTLVEMQVDVALEHDGGAEIGSGREQHRATALGFAGVDCCLNGVRVLGDTVGLGTIGANIAGGGGECADGCGCEKHGQGQANE